MKNYFLFVCLFFAFAVSLPAQEGNRSYTGRPAKSYTLEGIIDKDTGTIILMTGDTTNHTAIINHGRFSFTGTIDGTIGAMLRSKEGTDYLSGVFYIDPGVQTIICHKDSLRETPDISNSTMNEVAGSFKTAFNGYRHASDELDKFRDSLRAVYGPHLPDSMQLKWWNQVVYLRDVVYPSTLLAYTKKYPGSYVALWKLSSSINTRYLPIQDSIYASLSPALKRTSAGRTVKKKLEEGKSVAIGRKFAHFTLQDTTYAVKEISLKDSAHRYTLIDFWESHCGPCMQQFTKYKKVYEGYKNSGVEIIAISTDFTKDITLWKKVIHDKELPWPQYLDENGQLAASINIQQYPTNFLLDEHNVIIKRDVTPEQLAQIVNK